MTALLSIVLAALLGAPTWAAAHWCRRAGEGDAADRVSAAFVGFWCSVAGIWTAWRVAPTTLGTVVGVAAVTVVWMVSASGFRAAPRAARPSRWPARLAALGGAGALLAALPFLPWGLERADGIHRMAMTDWYKHLTVTTALALSESFPPANPFLYPSDDSAYYFGFHLLPAALLRGLGTAAPAFPLLVALSLLTFAAVPFVVRTVARDLVDDREAFVAAAIATFFAGFDIVVLLLGALVNVAGVDADGSWFQWLRAVVPSTHLDSWIHHVERQFNAPFLTAAWAPQHLAAALVAAMALHWQRGSVQSSTRRALAPALAIAVVPMLSAYVGLALLAALLAVVGRELWVARRAEPGATLRNWARVGLPALLLASPALDVLAGGGLGLTLRVSAAGDWKNGALFTTLLGDGQLARLLDTPAVYLFEFGLLGLLATLAVLRGWVGGGDGSKRRALERTLMVAITLLVLVAVVRPPVGAPNNLYARPLLLVWLLAAPLAARALVRLRGHRLVGLAALLCLAGTPYAVAGTVLEGALFWASPREDVEVANWSNDHLPEEAVLATDPEERPRDLAYRLRRRLLLADERHARLFGASADAYAAVAADVSRAFAAADPRAWRRLAELGATHAIGRADGAPTMTPCLAPMGGSGSWVVARIDVSRCE